nr:HNH endonuclease signature motif containing protein [Staphylococcus chromogenes]
MENDYICRSCGRQAQMVDHIIPTKVDWSKRLEKENLQPLCYECHNQKTKREQKEVPHIKERGAVRKATKNEAHSSSQRFPFF